MNTIFFEKDLAIKLPRARLVCIQFSVCVQDSNEQIKSLAKDVVDKVQSELSIDQVSQKPAIKETKEAYRVLGKDPSRYRPSAEALTRRVVSGKGLYWINNAVDLLNLVSLESGFSIGGYDGAKIDGDIRFGIGREAEPYLAIGRGDLNIANLPLFRDQSGAFGSPTSDSHRTMVTENTTEFLMIIIDFNSHQSLDRAVNRAKEMYEKIGVGSVIETRQVTAVG